MNLFFRSGVSWACAWASVSYPSSRLSTGLLFVWQEMLKTEKLCCVFALFGLSRMQLFHTRIRTLFKITSKTLYVDVKGLPVSLQIWSCHYAIHTCFCMVNKDFIKFSTFAQSNQALLSHFVKIRLIFRIIFKQILMQT